MAEQSIRDLRTLTEIKEYERRSLERLGLRWPVRETTFGLMVEVPHKAETDLIIICVNWGGESVPVRLLLPHQLYVHTILELIEDFPGTIEIEVFAVHHRDRLPVAALDRHWAQEPIPAWAEVERAEYPVACE